MRVINFLPWREALYRQRRKKYCAILLIVISLTVPLATAVYWEKLQARINHDNLILNLQATLPCLEQDSVRLLQTSTELAEVNKALQLLQYQWIQQTAWQQVMREWQTLAVETHIKQISWQGGRFLLRGVSELADPLRWFLHESPQWQLDQIGLTGPSGYQFVVSRVMPIEAGF